MLLLPAFHKRKKNGASVGRLVAGMEKLSSSWHGALEPPSRAKLLLDRAYPKVNTGPITNMKASLNYTYSEASPLGLTWQRTQCDLLS